MGTNLIFMSSSSSDMEKNISKSLVAHHREMEIEMLIIKFYKKTPHIRMHQKVT